MPNGFLLIDKEKGQTSFDVVRIIKKQINEKSVGHTGTLDKNTEGLLVLAIGKATKAIPLITKESTKTYKTTMIIGLETDTLDITGEVLQKRELKISEEQIKKTIKSFVKEYDQLPPKFSAKKINGKRASDLTREGKVIELKACKVNILDINQICVKNKEVTFVCKVTKGTYVRSLIRDIAQEMGTVATMKELNRLETDGFSVKGAKKVYNITNNDIISLEEYLLNNYDHEIVEEDRKKYILNGNMNYVIPNKKYPLLYLDNNRQPLALYDKINDKESKPILMIGG
ncbi:MAG: tRNA pseudouridine(55) synthase TruB [Mycoplasmatales bacterium]